MPSIPAKWRRYLYAVGAAFVPVTVAFGWLNNDQAAALVGVIYAVFMGALAAANTPKETNGNAE